MIDTEFRHAGSALIRTTTVTSIMALALWLIAGCGGDSDSPGDSASSGSGAGGLGGTGGAAGSSGSSAPAGSGGMAGSTAPSGGAGGGQAGAASAGQGGSSGSGTGAAQTTEDCSTHSETNHCLSVRGELDGVAFDFTCLADTGGLRVDVVINDAWSLRCSDAATGIEAFVTIPHQDPGPFAYGLADQDDSRVTIDLWKNSTLAIAISMLDELAITGEVQMDAGSAKRIVGTFEGTWSAGNDPSCMPDICASATVTGSYRSVFDF